MYLGLRNERIVSESTNTTSPLVNVSSVTSPVAHVTYKFDPKSKDMVRGSLTRSYKAPGLSTMLARPVMNAAYPNTNVPNPYLSTDRIGHPVLSPDLATDLAFAYETYLSQNGVY